MAVVEAGQAAQLVPHGAITEDSIMWGLSMVLTRAIRMPSRGGDEARVICPLGGGASTLASDGCRGALTLLVDISREAIGIACRYFPRGGK